MVYITLHRAGYVAGVRGGVLRAALPGTILTKHNHCMIMQTCLHECTAVANEHVENYDVMVSTGPNGVVFQTLHGKVWFP